MPGFPWWPPTASDYASQINFLFGSLLLGSLLCNYVAIVKRHRLFFRHADFFGICANEGARKDATGKHGKIIRFNGFQETDTNPG